MVPYVFSLAIRRYLQFDLMFVYLEVYNLLLTKYTMILAVKVIEELLKREWYTTGGERDKGTVFQQHLYVLLEVSLFLMCMGIECVMKENNVT